MQSPVRMKRAENAGAMATLVVHRLIVIWCVVLLFVNDVGVTSVTKRCVHIGEAIKLFSDTFGKYERVSMYTANGLLIASWSFRDDGIQIEHMNGTYSKKIYMDGNRNVWFLDVERKDAGKYVFKCGLQSELDLELTVLEKLTEEQLQECPNKCPGVSKMDFGGSHSETDHWITVNSVIMIIMGIFLLVFMIMGIWFACNMWSKIKPLTEDQVRKWLHDHPDFMEKNLDKQDSTKDHHTIYYQEAQSIIPAKSGVDNRSQEECRIEISVKDLISFFEPKGSPHGQPKLNKWQTKNVKRHRCSKGEDPVVHFTNPLLGERESET